MKMSLTKINGDLEGTILKWTNYWGGWQPRWLILQEGILSYYNSSDEVEKGCRASIKISASDIVAYPNDNTRFDIVVHNEQRWYLKCGNAAERQAWLISLGTSKAGSDNDKVTKSEQDSHNAHNELKACMSEVRLFCDLLVQQSVNVKEETQKATPDVKKLSDSSALLSTTCDTFLATLGRCLDLSEMTFNLPAPPGHMLMSMRSQSHDNEQAALPRRKNKHKKRHPRSMGPTPPLTPSATPVTFDSPLRASPEDKTSRNEDKVVTLSETSSLNSLTPESGDSVNNNAPIVGDNAKTMKGDNVENNGVIVTDNANPILNEINEDEETLLSFFSGMLHSFSDIVLEEDGGISTLSFLSACEGIIPFLDTIGSKAFAPVKMDFMGNISKIRTKHSSNPVKYRKVQDILHQEIKTSTTKVRNSATDALMWLKRGLRFIQKFLQIFKNGERNLTVALNKSYTETLKPFHGWVVKGIFALAVKAAPYPNDFIRALATTPDTADDKRFYPILMQDIDQYVTAMDVVLNILDNYYETHSLESNAVV